MVRYLLRVLQVEQEGSLVERLHQCVTFGNEILVSVQDTSAALELLRLVPVLQRRQWALMSESVQQLAVCAVWCNLLPCDRRQRCTWAFICTWP